MEIEQLKNALSLLDDEEYKLVKALFFEQKSLRDYAETIGKHYTTVYHNKIKLLKN